MANDILLVISYGLLKEMIDNAQFEREIALGQLVEIVNSCSNEDRLILEVC